MINEFGQKKAFSFHQETGEFLSVVWADPDPKNEGRYLLPASATFTALDEVEEGYVAVYKEGVKQSLVDNRGAEYWDKEGVKHTIKELGDTVPDSALLEAPIIPLTNEVLAEEVRAKRDGLLSEMSWRYERYASEQRLGMKTTDSIEALDEYAQALRDITLQEGFPVAIEWPKEL